MVTSFLLVVSVINLSVESITASECSSKSDCFCLITMMQHILQLT